MYALLKRQYFYEYHLLEVNLLAFPEFSLPEFAFEVSHNACLKITTFLEKAAVMKNC